MESRSIRAFAALFTFLFLAIPAIGMMFLAVAFYASNISIGLAWAFAVLSVATFLLAVAVSIEDFR
jgi:hypothetical protein